MSHTGQIRMCESDVQERAGLAEQVMRTRDYRLDGIQTDTFIEAAHPIPLKIDRDVLVADLPNLANDPRAKRRDRALATSSSPAISSRASIAGDSVVLLAPSS